MTTVQGQEGWKYRYATWASRMVGPRAESWAAILAVRLPVALAANAPHQVSSGFSQWAARLRGPRWPRAIALFLRRLNDPAFANALFDAVLPNRELGSPGARAVALCLAPAARRGYAEILDIAERLAAEAPSLLDASPVRVALSMLPHPRGEPPTPKVRQAIKQADLTRTMVIAPPAFHLADLAALFPDRTRLHVCTYRPARETLDRWVSEARSVHTVEIELVDTFQSGGDLNSDCQLVLSATADRIAQCVLVSPELSELLSIENFGARHGETAELALSDRLFSWFRTQTAFAEQIVAQRPTTVILVGSDVEVRHSVLGACENLACTPAVFEAGSAHSIGGLDRYWRAHGAPESSDRLEVDSTTVAVRAWAVRGVGTRFPGARPEGFAAWSGPRLYAPTADAVLASLAPHADIYRVPLETHARGAKCKVNLPADKVRGWLETAGATTKLSRLLSLDERHLVDRIHAICLRFLSTDLPKLVLTHANNQDEIRRRKPEFGVILPTRHPSLRIVARNLMATGVPVHEVQTVYLTSMPRYRPPAATHFHAIDTYSARQVSIAFGHPEEGVRLGGIVKKRAAVRSPRPLNGKNSVIIATQPTPLDENLSIIKSVCEAVARAGLDWSIVVRPHPAENSMRIAAYVAAASSHQVDPPDKPRALADADILVSAFSNLVVEGAVVGLRAIVFWRGEAPPPVPFEEMGIAVRARSVSDLVELFRDFARNGPVAQRLDQRRLSYLSKNPQLAGGAAASIAQEILATIA